MSCGFGGFFHDERSLGLHFQLLHAPRGVGALHNAAVLHDDWYEAVRNAFPPEEAAVT